MLYTLIYEVYDNKYGCFKTMSYCIELFEMQAFFAVVDGHGGHAAADYVADNLGKNIINAIENQVMEVVDERTVEQAIRDGYTETDKGFLSQVNISK